MVSAAPARCPRLTLGAQGRVPSASDRLPGCNLQEVRQPRRSTGLDRIPRQWKGPREHWALRTLAHPSRHRLASLRAAIRSPDYEPPHCALESPRGPTHTGAPGSRAGRCSPEEAEAGPRAAAARRGRVSLADRVLRRRVQGEWACWLGRRRRGMVGRCR